MVDVVKTQVLKEMRNGIPPKIDAWTFEYYKAGEVDCFHNQYYSLKFFEDGTVICRDAHVKKDPYERYDSGLRESNSVGVFEVRICKIVKTVSDSIKIICYDLCMIRFPIQL